MLTGKRLKVIWIFTALAAVVLAAFTIRYTMLSGSQEALVGQQVYIAGDNQLVLLRESAFSNATITAILERGMLVTVVEVETNTRVPWLLVESNADSGWIEAHNISMEPPE
ncbi:MAG: SH3 domain-containing protein [Anaerolineae bacterium]|nr:SH3 domain-containing protein [Anaerolineae bacterium]